jgi:hypothetical protein
MKKLEPYNQQHAFYDKVKEALLELGVTIAFTKNPDDTFTASTVTHVLPCPVGQVTEGYAELCRADLERQHVYELVMVVKKHLPNKVGEVSLESYTVWSNSEDPGWTLQSQVYVRRFVSPVVMRDE